MAYAEKHGRGWRARWRDADGGLRSASGFGTRKQAEGYGADREAGHRVYEFTRGQLTDALACIQIRPVNGKVPAEWMADALIEALSETLET